MSTSDDQRAIANEISRSTEDLEVCLGETGNTAIVLLVLGVSKEDDALDLVADGGRQFGDSTGHDGGTLSAR